MILRTIFDIYKNKFKLESGEEQLYGTQTIPGVTFTKEPQLKFEKNAKEIGYDKKNIYLVIEK